MGCGGAGVSAEFPVSRSSTVGTHRGHRACMPTSRIAQSLWPQSSEDHKGLIIIPVSFRSASNGCRRVKKGILLLFLIGTSNALPSSLFSL